MDDTLSLSCYNCITANRQVTTDVGIAVWPRDGTCIARPGRPIYPPARRGDGLEWFYDGVEAVPHTACSLDHARAAWIYLKLAS